MLQSPYEALHHLSLVLLIKVDWIQDVLHSLTTAFHQQFTLSPVSLACDVTAIAENPAQINGGNINTEETEAKIMLILKRLMEATLTPNEMINGLIHTFFMKYGPTPCDKKCRSEYHTLFPFFGEGLGTRLPHINHRPSP